MFIEVTSKDKPLYIRVGDIMAVGVDNKNNVSLITDSLGGVVVNETYETVKYLIDEAEKRMFPFPTKVSELKT